MHALNALGWWRALVVIVACILATFWLGVAVFFGVLPAGPGLRNRLGGVAAGDFMFFYSVGVLARNDAAAVYDAERLTATGRATLGEVPELVWPYPPTMSLPLVLLGGCPPAMALVIWVGLSLAALLALARLALGAWRLSPIVLLCPASAFALFTGQISPVLALLLGLFMVFSQWPSISGASLGMFVVKPHLGIAAAALAFVGRERRALASAALVAAVFIGASLVAFGLQPWRSFFEEGMRHSGLLQAEVPLPRLATVFGAAYTAGLGPGLALGLHALAALFAGHAAWRLWTRSATASVRALALTAATVLVPPYALDYDLVVLALPWLLMIRESLANPAVSRALFWPWIGLTALVPVSYLVALYTGQSISGPLLLLVLGWGVGSRLARSQTRPRPV